MILSGRSRATKLYNIYPQILRDHAKMANNDIEENTITSLT